MSIYDYESCLTCEVICPYCQHKDGYTGDSLGDQEETEVTCGECGKEFRVKMEATYSHECYKLEEDEDE